MKVQKDRCSMAELELSCGLPPGPDFADLVVLAESPGYSRVWVFDSPPLWEDPFVHLALAAQRTGRIELGAAVLIPQQRSVMATASAIATVARLSGNRFRPCFGTGFTARLALGPRPIASAKRSAHGVSSTGTVPTPGAVRMRSMPCPAVRTGRRRRTRRDCSV